ncbi:MAG: GNAT family N-acetyltransferase [Bacteroidetes bacterium]|nr:GNAT family N-acetyltransferase [Bacteroidota bacterium]
MHEIEIIYFTANHIDAALSISNSWFGAGYHDEAFFRQFINSEKHFGYAAVSGNRLIGFTMIQIYKPQELPERITLHGISDLTQFEDMDAIAVGGPTAVLTEFQKNGIGHALIARREKALNGRVNAVISVGWKTSKGVHIGSILTKKDMKSKTRSPIIGLKKALKSIVRVPYAVRPSAIAQR